MSSAIASLRSLRRSGRPVINLCFHGIGEPQRELEPGEAAYWISPTLYEQVLDAVAGRDDIRLSFDDGNTSDIQWGLPGLLDRGLSAIFFPLAGRLDQSGSLSAADLGELRSAGMTIGTHGMDHRPWRGLSVEDARRELVEARQVLEQAAGVEIDEAAMPLGRYDRGTLARLRAAGYAVVHSSDRRRARAGAWFQPRYSLRASDTIEIVRDQVLAEPTQLSRAKNELKGVLKRLR